MEILAALAKPCSLETAVETRVAAFYSAIAAYDRQFDRAPFVQTTTRALHLIETLRKAEILTLVYSDLFTGKYSLEEIKEACGAMLGKLLEQAEAERALVHHNMKLIAECAWENDTIN